MSELRIPAATYRIQFSLGFRFVDGQELVPYLSDLGITDLYSSPRFRARRGSPHAYDVSHPTRINSELGTEEEFEELAEKLNNYSMGLILDIVPNHMAASHENPWWMDVLENGKCSMYASHFDIDWDRAGAKAPEETRIVLPVLGDLFGTVLENQELILKLDENGLFVRYYEHRLPLDPRSYPRVLEDCRERSAGSMDDTGRAEFDAVIEELRGLPAVPEPAQIERRHQRKEELKKRLWRLYTADPEVRECFEETFRVFNGAKGDARSFDRLADLLSVQAYRPAYWRMAAEEINYRRFFDINDLVGVRVEDPRVFEDRHSEIFSLIARRMVTGLRVDHVDGLYDPHRYLERLQKRVAGPGGKFYVVVEKILAGDEHIPDDWQAFGTTGYGFLNYLNGLFVHPEGLRQLDGTYRRFSGVAESFAEVRYRRKKLVMETLFAGEVQELGRHLGRLASEDRHARDLPFSEIVRALVETTACLTVYRTYIRGFEVGAKDREYIERAVEQAPRLSSGAVCPAVWTFLRRVLLLDLPHYVRRPDEWLRFVRRWQQFTGPVMAKGFEDTTCYVYNRLVSQNEVGSDPEISDHPVDLQGFHERNRYRIAYRPHTMNTTSTHDTKRSEDVRARINVLSEFPEEWDAAVTRWSELNAAHKREVDGRPAPDANDEIFLYQALVGAWPLCDEDTPAFRDRIKNYVQKSAREAKVHSSWLNPCEEYENALLGFVDAIFDSGQNAFLAEFLPFQARIACAGWINALGQVLLKITSPGLPDFYQGTELWDLSLVDPDNRRPVDFGKRMQLLESLRRREAEDRPALVADLVSNWRDGAIKLYLTYRALNFRRGRREVFEEGHYIPVFAGGSKREHVCGFARNSGESWALVAAPRWVAKLMAACGAEEAGPEIWGADGLILPAEAPASWKNVLTGEQLEAAEEGGSRVLRLADVFGRFPVGLFEGGPHAPHAAK
jgi:(1->4)-alpha-D-glucan 1-alpha-D-glucosylmutase